MALVSRMIKSQLVTTFRVSWLPSPSQICLFYLPSLVTLTFLLTHQVYSLHKLCTCFSFSVIFFLWIFPKYSGLDSDKTNIRRTNITLNCGAFYLSMFSLLLPVKLSLIVNSKRQPSYHIHFGEDGKQESGDSPAVLSLGYNTKGEALNSGVGFYLFYKYMSLQVQDYYTLGWTLVFSIRFESL